MDDGSVAGPVIDQAGYAGVRSDDMDLTLDDYSIREAEES